MKSYVFSSIFFLICSYCCHAHGQALRSELTDIYPTYYISTEPVRKTYPEVFLRLFQYLMQSYHMKFCLSSSDIVDLDNFVKLNRAIERDFPNLSKDFRTNKMLSPASLYRKIISHVYPIVPTYHPDLSEQKRLVEQNDRYTKIRFGLEGKLLDKVLPIYYKDGERLVIKELELWEMSLIKESLILSLLELMAEKPAKTAACFPWDSEQAFTVDQTRNYLEGLLKNLATNVSNMKVCEQFDLLLDFLSYSKLSSLSATSNDFKQSLNFNNHNGSTTDCSQDSFLSKIQSL